MSKIRLLSSDLVNQIAAGEIVERPSAALKELVENSIDAGSRNIDIFLQNAGKSKMVVQDDGEGLSEEDLKMAIQRHATSKLSGNNLFDIKSYGFRGEAIPSIASVSNFSLESRSLGISVNFSQTSELYPSIVETGTRVTVEDLFARLPARLKFLKSDSLELAACLNVIENIALAIPTVNFTLRSGDKTLLTFAGDSLDERVSKIFGSDLFKKSVKFKKEDKNLSVSGYLFHPMDSRYSQSSQKFFVNNRIIKDKTLTLAIRNAYKDLILPGRFAVVLIFIEIDPFHIDVNVSPTKSEIRFRDAHFVQKFLTTSIRENLEKFDRISNEVPISYIDPSVSKLHFQSKSFRPENIESHFIDSPETKTDHFQQCEKLQFQESNEVFEPDEPYESPAPSLQANVIEETESFFGEPIAQVFDSYIITKTASGIMIIDQHAVHEKIMQNKILESISPTDKQFLAKPEILELTRSETEIAKLVIASLRECGFSLDLIQNSIMISGIPGILKVEEAIGFIKDFLTEFDAKDNLDVIELAKHRIADKACHNSVRFGRKLSLEEMRSLIDQMENNISIHQCNHHRPSFVQLTKDQLQKLFERS